MTPRYPDVATNLAAHIAPGPGDCVTWTGKVSGGGYGRIAQGGKQYTAHRVAYELAVGPIPNGLELDHICHTQDKTCAGGVTCPHRRCVNPAHLEPVTPRENTIRGMSSAAVNALKTHCKRGHEFTPENTYTRRDRPGRRTCITCKHEQLKVWRWAVRATRAAATAPATQNGDPT